MNETSPQLDPAVFEAMGKIAVAVGPLPHHLQVVTLKMATAFVGGRLLSNGNGNVHAFAPAAPAAPAALAPAPEPVEVVQVNKVTGKKSSGGSSKSKAAQRARKPGAAANGAVTTIVLRVLGDSPLGAAMTAEEVWNEQEQFTKVQIQAALSNHVSKTDKSQQRFRKAPKSHKTGPNRYIYIRRD